MRSDDSLFRSIWDLSYYAGPVTVGYRGAHDVNKYLSCSGYTVPCDTDIEIEMVAKWARAVSRREANTPVPSPGELVSILNDILQAIEMAPEEKE